MTLPKTKLHWNDLVLKFRGALEAKNVDASLGKLHPYIKFYVNRSATKKNWHFVLEQWEKDGFPVLQLLQDPPPQDQLRKELDQDQNRRGKKNRVAQPRSSRKPRTASEGYNNYLAGDLWNAIREYVLLTAGHNCKCCGNHANQVHHMSYDKMTMRGRDTSKLVAICDKCHHDLHFDESGKKLTLAEANARLMDKLLQR